MKFSQLPTELVAAVMGRCDYPTAVNLSKTCSQMNKITKGYHFEKIDVDCIYLNHNPTHDQSLRIGHCSKFEKNWRGHREFYSTYRLSEDPKRQKSCQNSYEKTREILMSIRITSEISFNSFTIDENFIQMIKETSIDWKHVSARFLHCSYKIHKEDLVSYWETFQSVYDLESTFQESKAEVVNDEIMLRILPNITINNHYPIAGKGLERNSRLTDITLEFLSENRPKFLGIGPFIANYTLEGIKELFIKIISTRDPNVDDWCLGAVELNIEGFLQLINDMKEICNNEYSEFLGFDDWKGNTCTMVVNYKKEINEDKAILRLALVKPPEVIEAERRIGLHKEITEEKEDNLNDQPDHQHYNV